MQSDLIITGGARCLWEDWHGAPKARADVMAINYSALFLGVHVHHLFSMHDYVLEPIRTFFKFHHHRQDPLPVTHSNSQCEGVDRVWSFKLNGGSSGCYAAAVGVALGYDRIILCGCPADETGNFYDPPWKNDDFRKKRKVWKMAAEKHFEGKVISMSGWTKELLG